MHLTEEQIAAALADPRRTALELDRVEMERSLLTYTRYMWHTLEPTSRPFVDGWPIQAIAEHLEAVTRGEIKFLLIDVPPGFWKSLGTCVYWPTWEWGPKNRPALRYCSWSYNEGLTIDTNVKSRRLILHPAYQALWGDRFALMSDVNAKVKFDNDKTGFRFASTVRGAGTGWRGDRKILDDPHSVKEAESDLQREAAIAFFAETLASRDNDENTVTVVIMQRVHERDVAGHILRTMPNAEVLCVPMWFEGDHPVAGKRPSFLGWRDPRSLDKPSPLCPEVGEGALAYPQLFTPRRVADMAAQMRSWGGEYAVAGQLQQRPEPRGGGMFRAEWVKWVSEAEVPAGGFSTRGWDLASTEGGGDFTSGTRLQRSGGKYYVLGGVHGQWGPGKVALTLRATAEADGHGVWQCIPQDPGQAGKYQVGDFVSLLDGFVVRWSPETGSKATRAQPFASQMEAGNVFFVDNEHNRWLVSQMPKFPKGGLDDGVDSLSRAYGELCQIPEPVAIEGPTIVDPTQAERSHRPGLPEIAESPPVVVPKRGPEQEIDLFDSIGAVY